MPNDVIVKVTGPGATTATLTAGDTVQVTVKDASRTTWDNLPGKPEQFPPEAHTHVVADVTGLQAALDGKQPAGSYAAAVHTHTAAAITDFAAAVVAAAPPTTNASLLTTGTLPDARLSSNIARTSDVTAAVNAVIDAAPAALNTLNELAAALGDDANFASTVTNALAGKAAAAHTHVVADVTGLQAALDGKQVAGSYAAAVHTHAIADVTGLQAALDGKQVAGSYAAASHTHAASDIGSGTIATARLGSGTASSSTFLRGDQAYGPASEVFDFTRTTAPSGATGGSGAWTWTLPSAAKSLRLIAIAGGGGGGSGRRGAAGTARFGGGSGTGGILADSLVSVAELSTLTLKITVGSGGAGGAARTTDDTNGAAGTTGGLSKVTPGNASLAPALVYAPSLGAGSGGTAAAGAAGFENLRVSEPCQAGTGSSITGTPGGGTGASTTASSRSATSGGGGGGIDASDVSRSGGGAVRSNYIATDNLGISQGTGGASPGGNGTAGGNNAGYTVAGGQGGGGGAAGNSTTAAGNGGDGAYPGGGGGGGGASFNGYSSGAGGNGGDGFVRIVVFY